MKRVAKGEKVFAKCKACHDFTQGGPNNASRPIVLFIYEQGFRSWNLGYAAAASEVLFLIMAIAAVAQFFASRKRVEE